MVDRLDVEEILREFPPRFESKPVYSPEDDAVHFYFEDADHHAQRIDCWLTVFRSFDDDRIVGFKLKNIRVLLSRFDALGLDYRVSPGGWQIRLQTFFAYIPAIESDVDRVPDYRGLLTSFGKRLNQEVDVACG